MCVGRAPKPPRVYNRPPPPAPAPKPTPAEAPRAIDVGVSNARRTEGKRLRRLAGRSRSIATSSQGLTAPANVQGKQLTGQ